ncbi:MAG: DoxX family protein [Methylococcales bacterium]
MNNALFLKLINSYKNSIRLLNNHADQLPPLLLRFILAYEFWEAGVMKYQGENWFSNILFPMPFSLLSVDLLWTMGTWLEMIGAIALVLGLGTRLFTLLMMVLTIVAINTVHWPSEWNTLSELWQGYAISNKGQGNFKLPLLYLIMFMPLLFGGAGRWSLDHVIYKQVKIEGSD